MGAETIKIAITGTESTGKTQLARELSRYFGGQHLEEYAREYLTDFTGDYTIDDILTIAKIQKRQENDILKQKPKIFFADTELLVTKIWAKNAFGKVPQWIGDELEKQHYDLYLLTNIDMPWEYDPLREHPSEEQRKYFFDWYKRELAAYQFPYQLVSGLGKQRIENAIAIVKNILEI